MSSLPICLSFDIHDVNVSATKFWSVVGPEDGGPFEEVGRGELPWEAASSSLFSPSLCSVALLLNLEKEERCFIACGEEVLSIQRFSADEASYVLSQAFAVTQ